MIRRPFSACAPAFAILVIIAGCVQPPNWANTGAEPVETSIPGPESCARLDGAPEQLRGQPGYTQIAVTVTDQSRSFLQGLGRNDFKLYEAERPADIRFFRQDSQSPVSVGILIDTSGSMEPKLTQVATATEQFLSHLDSRDDIFLVAFSDSPFMLQNLTTDHSLIAKRLKLLHAFGRTALYDSVASGLQTAQHGCYDRRALLLITDGIDTASRRSLAEVIAKSHEEGVPVYTIGIGNPKPKPSSPLAIGVIVLSGGDEDRVDPKTLNALSGETGATTSVVDIADATELNKACDEVAQELRSQYTLGFIAADPPNVYKSLRIVIAGHGGAKTRIVRETVSTAPVGPAGATN